LNEAFEQQAATADILNIISNSPTDTQPVFEAIVQSVLKLFPNALISLALRYGDRINAAAVADRDPGRAEAWRRTISRTPLFREYMHSAAMLDCRIVDVPDASSAPAEFSAGARNLLTSGNRAITIMPMMRRNEAIGLLSVVRRRPGPLPDKQLSLLRTFAAQAVIAIENARLLNELRESLQQQTATADVLKVISSSPGELAPVFQSMLAKAVQICEAKFGVLFRCYHDREFHAAAWVGVTPEYEESLQKRQAFHPDADAPLGRLLRTKELVHSADEVAEKSSSPAAKYGGARSLVALPMRKENVLVGALVIYRTEVRPFTSKQIELVQNFAAQAVIAIENARLLNELRHRTNDLSESLQQQTATAEILDVISNSPTDSQPAFDAIVRSGLKLFPDAAIMIALPDGDIVRSIAVADANLAGAEALRARTPLPLSREFITSTAILDRREIDLPDAREAPPELAVGARNFLASGYRAITAIPMMRGESAIGALDVIRREPGPLSDKQRDLLRTFANQAVIAIENTRLFNELRQRTTDLTESLEQQTATSEVLRVISGSPTNVQPVFDSIAESAVRLCGGQFSFMVRFDGKAMDFASSFGLSIEGLDAFRRLLPQPASEGTASGRAILNRAVVEIADVRADQAYGVQGLAQTVTYRSIVAVPLLHEGSPIGAIAVARANAGSFPQRQIAVLEAFADQAVIAIRNVRLFDEVQARSRELSESLDQQTATSKVLDVISRSAFDLQAVFETVAESAVKLCGADRAFIWRFDGELLRMIVAYNAPQELKAYVAENPIRPGRDSTAARAALERRTVHIPDVLADSEYSFGTKNIDQLRTTLAVPILKGDDLLGVMTIYHVERVNPFSDKQIALVETFGDQAAIAIDNVRLLDELRHRTTELGRSVSELQALGEVSQAVNSTLDLETVLSTIVAKAVELSDTEAGAIYGYDEHTREFRLRATHGMDQGLIEVLTQRHIDLADPTIAAIFAQREPTQVADLREEAVSELNGIILLAGYRARMVAPLLRGEDIVGMLVVRRRTPGAFAKNIVDIIKTFAAQSALAIQNARLFHEIEDKSR